MTFARLQKLKSSRQTEKSEAQAEHDIKTKEKVSTYKICVRSMYTEPEQFFLPLPAGSPAPVAPR